ncbi:MAG: efflux transporter outer membrane subunit [Pseudomonadota bacterium]
MTPINRIMTTLCLVPGVLFLIAGCSTLAPKYSQPATPVPATWPSGPAYPVASIDSASEPVANRSWQSFFADWRLQQLIILALENNRDLRVTALNIERSRALYQIKRSDLLPKVDGSAAANFERISESFSGTGRASTAEQYSVGLGNSSFELDFFGRVRSLKDQALEQYLATEHALGSTRISLVAEVARNYLTLAADRERLKLARETLSSRQYSLVLVQGRFDAGVTTALDLYQAQTTVDSARADIAGYLSQIAQDENALSLVLGAAAPTGLLPDGLAETISPIGEIPVGLPSDVLRHRPDILQAESLLKAANANIGAARAAFFPRITMVSGVGTASDSLLDLFQSGTTIWNFTPKIQLPIFDAGSNQANLKVAQADRDIAIAQYEKAIQVAFREVADALAQRGTIDDQLAARESLADASAKSYFLSEARYEKGVDSFLTVLDSQRSLYSARQTLITTRLSRLINQVTLYKVTGGGV